MTRSILTLIGYFALTAIVVLTTVALVAYGQGYTYDFKNNRFTHNGLVLISTNPSGATVKVELKSGTKKTPYHASFEAGSYRFNVTKSGYEPWTKVLKVVASQVTLAQYIVLLPKDRPQTVIDRRAAMTNQVITRDHRSMAYIVPGADGGLYTIDLTSNRATRVYQPIAASGAVAEEVLTDVAWSDDASRILLGSTVAGKYTKRLITVSDGVAQNLTEKFNFDFTSLQFSGRDSRQLYWLNPDGIRRLDLNAQTVTGILADKVSQFVIAGDRVLYVQTTDLGESLGSLDSRDRKETIIQALVKSPTYSMEYQTYQGRDFLAVIPSSNGIGTLYSDIYSNNISAKVVAQNVTDVIYSTDNHIATFYSPTKLVSYDFDRSAQLGRAVTDTALIPIGKEISTLSYYDGDHLLVNQAGRLVFMEFDGQNGVDLGPIALGTVAYRVTDQKAIVHSILGIDNTALNVISIR